MAYLSRNLLAQLTRFAVVGMVNTVAGVSCIYAAMLSGIPPLQANAIGYGLGLAMSYILNRSWTFRERGAGQKSLARFLGVVVACYAVNLIIVELLLRSGRTSPYLAQLGGVAGYTLLMFLGCRWFAFSNGPERTK